MEFCFHNVSLSSTPWVFLVSSCFVFAHLCPCALPRCGDVVTYTDKQKSLAYLCFFMNWKCCVHCVHLDVQIIIIIQWSAGALKNAGQLKSCSPILPTSKAFLVGLPLSMEDQLKIPFTCSKSRKSPLQTVLKGPRNSQRLPFSHYHENKEWYWRPLSVDHISTLTPIRNAADRYQPVFSCVVQRSHDKGAHNSLLFWLT